MTNAEAAQLLDTDEETIEAAVDELGLENNLITVAALDAIDDLLDDDDGDGDDDDDDACDGEDDEEQDDEDDDDDDEP